MAEFRRQLQLQHPPSFLYDIVADVGRYAEFLPWLDGVEILSRSENQVDAALKVARAGGHAEYITRYHLEPHKRISTQLVDGPLHRLDGTWTFLDGAGGSLLGLHVDYEFSNPLFGMLFGQTFRTTIDDLLKHVAARARHLQA